MVAQDSTGWGRSAQRIGRQNDGRSGVGRPLVVGVGLALWMDHAGEIVALLGAEMLGPGEHFECHIAIADG